MVAVMASTNGRACTTSATGTTTIRAGGLMRDVDLPRDRHDRRTSTDYVRCLGVVTKSG
jgi:hypothetical protein